MFYVQGYGSSVFFYTSWAGENYALIISVMELGTKPYKLSGLCKCLFTILKTDVLEILVDWWSITMGEHDCGNPSLSVIVGVRVNCVAAADYLIVVIGGQRRQD